jgi:hypothetical protein
MFKLVVIISLVAFISLINGNFQDKANEARKLKVDRSIDICFALFHFSGVVYMCDYRLFFSMQYAFCSIRLVEKGAHPNFANMTFAGTPPGLSPIGECSVGESLIGEVRVPREMSTSLAIH